MRHKKQVECRTWNVKSLRVLTLLTFALSLSSATAQTMYVKETGGTQTSYALSKVRKMSFSSGNLTVIKTDNSSGVFALNGLRYLNFSIVTTGLEEYKDIEKQSLNTYPNPVINELNIDLRGTSSLNGTIDILNLKGLVIKAQQVKGESVVSVDMSQLPKGMYLCRYSNGIEIKTVKIIKQ